MFGTLPLSTLALALPSGALIGLSLGLVGGGGSILAVPLLVYVVGVSSPHVAIGTSAVAVALNAAFGLLAHARQGTVKWGCALVFAAAGVLGAGAGAAFGKAIAGERLLFLFGLLMIGVGVSMFRGRHGASGGDIALTRSTARSLVPRLVAIGSVVGLLSGFFGIGGGFLIVPGLVLATGMGVKDAVGTSLVAVTAFGLTTAGSYAASGLVDWPIAALVVAGGALGGFVGARASVLLGRRRQALPRLFATLVVLVGAYVTYRGFAFA